MSQYLDKTGLKKTLTELDKKFNDEVGITKGTSTNSIDIFDGNATSEYSIAAGTNSKDSIIPIVGSTLAGAISVSVPTASGVGSIAFGGGAEATSAGSIALGSLNRVGVTGFYWNSIDFTNKTITLSTSQSAAEWNLPSGVSFDWHYKGESKGFLQGSWEGDMISIVNNAKYPFCARITAISGNVITVDNLPFTEVTKPSTTMPDDYTIFACYRKDIATQGLAALVTQERWYPRSGSITIGWAGTAFGIENLVSGSAGFASGWNNWTAGDFGATFGRDNISGYASASFGQGNTTSGTSSLSLGVDNITTGNASFTSGKENTTSGAQAVTVGYQNTASGAHSFAGGSGSSATNTNALAFGKSNIASGQNSVAFGSNNEARGNRSIATGYQSISCGESDAVFGTGTISSATVDDGSEVLGNSQLVCGKYNSPIRGGALGNANGYNGALFIVGNGYKDANNENAIVRRNAFVVNSNGSATLQAQLTLGASPTSSMHAATKQYVDKIDITKSSDNEITFTKADGTTVTFIDDNENTTYTLKRLGGTLTLSGTDGSVQSVIAQVQSDWTNYDTTSSAHIQNTPSIHPGKVASSVTIGSHSTSSEPNVANEVCSTVAGKCNTAYGQQDFVVGAHNISSYRDGTGALGNTQFVCGKYNSPLRGGAWGNTNGVLFIIGNGTGEDSRSNALIVRGNGDTEINGDLLVNKVTAKNSTTSSSTDLTLTTKDYVDNLINNIETFDIDKVYPIGSIYMSVNSTDPSTLFGGYWEAIGGRFLLGADSTYTAGSTGGAATHTLTINEMPSHSHRQIYDVAIGTGTAAGNGGYEQFSGSAYASNNTATTGGSQAHNNMPPYLAVYMWKRVLKCEWCDDFVDNQEELETHVNTQHSCAYCSTIVSSLHSHLLSKHYCEGCECYVENLANHTHYTCPNCGGIVSSTNCGYCGLEDVINPTYQDCRYCGERILVFDDDVYLHEEACSYNPDNEDPSTEENLYICDDCGAEFTSASELDDHMSSDHLYCSYCGEYVSEDHYDVGCPNY